jgi:hypothetical protein
MTRLMLPGSVRFLPELRYANAGSNAYCAIGLVLCLAVLPSCLKADPCFPNSKGKQYRVSIVERWDSSSRFPGGQPASFACPDGLDLRPGVSFVVQVDVFSASAPGCSCGSGSVVQSPDGWAWAGSMDAECGGSFFELKTNVTNGTCSGISDVAIEASKVPTGAEVPGQRPVAYLSRSFQDGTGDCGPISARACADSFVIEIEQL